MCLAVAGHSSRLAAMAGLTLPIETHVLQAFVSESIKPVIDVVLTYGAGHFYVSQSDKGGLVFGGAIDGYNTYAPARHAAHGRGSGGRGRDADAGARAPESAAAMGRRHGHDAWTARPSSRRRRSTGLILNGGWCYGGFKAIPAGGMTTAHLIAHGAPHPLAAHLDLGPLRRRAHHR